MLDEKIKSPNKKIFDFFKKIDVKSPNIFRNNYLKLLMKNDLLTSDQKPNFINNHNYNYNIHIHKTPKKSKKNLSVEKLSNYKKYIVNLIQQNIKKRNNILPKLKINIFKPNIFIVSSHKRCETRENNHKKVKMRNFSKNIKYSRLPHINKSFQSTEEKNNSILTENDIQITNNISQINKHISSSSTNTEPQNKKPKKIIEIENKNFEKFFKNIEKNIEAKKNYIDVNNMMERIEDLKKYSQAKNDYNENDVIDNNNEMYTSKNNKEHSNFFISGVIDYNKNDLNSLKKELEIEIKNNLKYEGEKNEKNSIELSSEIEKLKNKDEQVIFDINKKLINKEKIINLCKINTVPDSIFEGKYYKNIKKIEMISHKIINTKLDPLNLDKKSIMRSLTNEKI